MNKFYEKSYQNVNIIEKTVLFIHQNTFYNGVTENRIIFRNNNKEFNSGKVAYDQYYHFQYHRDKLSEKECSCAEDIPDLNEEVEGEIFLPKETYECEISKKSVHFGIPPKKKKLAFLE